MSKPYAFVNERGHNHTDLHTGEIADYAKNVKGVSKVASAMSKGTALDVGAGALEIKEACSTGREEECSRAKFVESGKAGGGIIGSWAGGVVGVSAGPAICVGLGVPSGGTVTAICALVGIGLLAFGGGKAGSMAGGEITTVLYETTHDR